MMAPVVTKKRHNGQLDLIKTQWSKFPDKYEITKKQSYDLLRNNVKMVWQKLQSEKCKVIIEEYFFFKKYNHRY